MGEDGLEHRLLGECDDTLRLIGSEDSRLDGVRTSDNTITALEEELSRSSSGTSSQNGLSLDEIPEEWEVDDDELAAMYEEYMKELEVDAQSPHQQQLPSQASYQLSSRNPMLGSIESIDDDLNSPLDDLMQS